MASPAVSFRNEVPDRVDPAQPVAPEKAGPTAEEFASLQRELNEVRESAEVWKGIATRTAPTQTPAADEKPARTSAADIDWGEDEAITDEPEDVTAEALLDDLSKSGLGALKKHGFVRKSDVVRIAREESRKAAATASTQVVQRARTEVTSETKIMQEFPDLADEGSEFFKIAADHVRAAVKMNPEAKHNPATLYLAARAAKAELAGKVQPGRRGQQAEDIDDEPEPPRRTQRQEHIAAQHGDRGRGRSVVDTGHDDDPGLNDDELSVSRALGIDPKDYKAEKTRLAKQGGGRGKR